MKYCKVWQKDMLTLPPRLQNSCIDYKKWKKRIVGDANGLCSKDYIDILNNECKKIDLIFRKIYMFKISRVWKFMYQDIDICDIRNYAKINARTMYKICKKIAKKTGESEMRSWLISQCTNHTYAFLGSEITSHLDILIGNGGDEGIECPICFERKSEKKSDQKSGPRSSYLILPCGHIICLSCALHQANVHEKRGLWFNVLACANQIRCMCPLCRFPGAFQKTGHIMFLK